VARAEAALAATATVMGFGDGRKTKGGDGHQSNESEHTGCAEGVHRSVSSKRGFSLTGHLTRSLSHTGDIRGCYRRGPRTWPNRENPEKNADSAIKKPFRAATPTDLGPFVQPVRSFRLADWQFVIRHPKQTSHRLPHETPSLVCRNLGFDKCNSGGPLVGRANLTGLPIGLLTYDTVSQREWLDVTETGRTIEQMIPKLSPGGPFAGFSIASIADVSALVASGGYDASQNHGQRLDSANSLIDLLGETFAIETSFGLYNGGIASSNPTLVWRLSDGLSLDRGQLGPGVRFVINTEDSLPHEDGGVQFVDPHESFVGTGFNYYPNGFDFGNIHGVWLYRSAAAPEPATIWLLAESILIAGLALKHCRPITAAGTGRRSRHWGPA
jgi:hypothetical protein